MVRAGFAAAIGGMLFAGTCAWAVSPVEDFGNLPAISQATISPDGKHLATVEPVDGRPVVLVYDVDPKPGAKPVGFDEPGGTPVGIYWANDDRLICLYNAVVNQATAQGMFLRNNSRAISVSISGKDPAILMKGQLAFKINGSTISILGRDPDGSHVYLAAYGLEGNVDLFRADVEDEDAKMVGAGTDTTGDWVMGLNGVPIARIDYYPGGSTSPFPIAHVFVNGKDGWRDSLQYQTVGPRQATVEGLTQDGSALAIERLGTRDTRGLDSFPLTGDEARTLFADPLYDVDGAVSDLWTGAIIGAHYVGDMPKTVWFDDGIARIQRGLEKAIPGQTVEIVSFDARRENFIVTSTNSRNPPVYWIYNATTHQLKALAAAYPNLQPADLGETRPYPYKARDGLDIHAYLTLPPGAAAKNLPLVVFPHGGPELRDDAGFDWWAQFMVSRGYAVFQPNFRGSGGYGWDFRLAGFGQWGLKMQDDITDGVKKLIADGMVDPKRICIVGASYGGYAALAGATFTPELYACAVSVAGVSNIANLVGGSDASDYWRARIGDIETQEDAMDKVSPALHAANVRGPILLMHGDHDVTVPFGQSNLEQIALKKAGKQVELITLENDDHYLNLASTRIKMLQEIEKFLAANIGR
ncbi:MAG TPA: S9 family peptidase [Rhizomicrobium sp.]|nr:S9 family peptidase [Rhizomicrobium sp.]